MARIIYAEDDELIGDIVRNTLIDQGHAVGVVGDGQAALEAVQARRPDLLILDCSMPEMSGIDVLRNIRTDENLYDVPVLILSGRRTRHDIDLAMIAGANDYLTKPFDPEQLILAVEGLLDSAEQRYGSTG